MDIKITGIDEVCDALTELPPTMAKVAFGKALTAACVPVVRELQARTPEGTGDLKNHIVTDVALDSQGKGGYARIGFGKLGYIARFVEYGHRMLGHKPLKKDTGKTVQPHPFMRPAIANTAEESIEAFAESVKESLGL